MAVEFHFFKYEMCKNLDYAVKLWKLSWIHKKIVKKLEEMNGFV